MLLRGTADLSDTTGKRKVDPVNRWKSIQPCQDAPEAAWLLYPCSDTFGFDTARYELGHNCQLVIQSKHLCQAVSQAMDFLPPHRWSLLLELNRVPCHH